MTKNDSRSSDSRISGSSGRQETGGMSGDVINPRISREEVEFAVRDGSHRGSGSDVNSKEGRLHDPENLQDKAEEDTFPASDPPAASSPATGFGRRHPEQLPKDFKDNKAAQFEYGRRTEDKTHHFDTSTRRHAMGNPDIGEVDLGTIEADMPAQPDDHDHFDSADDDL